MTEKRSLTFSLADGVHGLFGRVTDSAGLISTISGITITIDTIAPTAPQFEYPTSGAVLNT